MTNNEIVVWRYEISKLYLIHVLRKNMAGPTGIEPHEANLTNQISHFFLCLKRNRHQNGSLGFEP